MLRFNRKAHKAMGLFVLSNYGSWNEYSRVEKMNLSLILTLEGCGISGYSVARERWVSKRSLREVFWLMLKTKASFVVQSLRTVQGWSIFTGAETLSSSCLERSWLKLKTVKAPNPSRAECIREGSLGGNVSICNCY